MCENEGGNLNWKDLPTLPNQVGGQTDIIIGLKYKKYFPKEIHIFPSGLTVYSSQFKGGRWDCRSPRGTTSRIHKGG